MRRVARQKAGPHRWEADAGGETAEAQRRRDPQPGGEAGARGGAQSRGPWGARGGALEVGSRARIGAAYTRQERQ